MKHWKSSLCFMLVFLFAAWTTVASAKDIVVGFTGPLSGPAAEYGQDCLNGIDMAVKEFNAAGGVKVNGRKYIFRLEQLDDAVDPTRAKHNAMRFVVQNKAPIVFVPIRATGDKFPNALFTIDDRGVTYCGGVLQQVTAGPSCQIQQGGLHFQLPQNPGSV